MVDLSISIINYKTKDLATKCLESILNKKWKVDFKIWLIDNNSKDGSVENFKKNYPNVNLIESNKNLGFAGGHNLVLKKTKSRYVLILNSDTEILDQTLDKMVSFMESHPEVGIASCKVLGFDGKLQPNGGDLPLGAALISWLFNFEMIFKSSFHRNDPEYYEVVKEVGWVSGNFMLVKSEVFSKVGYLNEEYFMYFEDSEFCYKTKLAGYKIMINPKVSIKHLSGGSLDDPLYRQWLGEFRGLLIFYKQFGPFYTLSLRIWIYIAILARILTLALMGKLRYAKTYAKVFFYL